VNDNSNSCKTLLSIPIIQNTVAPNVSASMYTQTLTCNTPTVLATGTSSTPNTQINWNEPVPPPLVSTSTIVIGPGSGPNTSSTSLTYANYTVIATNTLNACLSTSVITINQNFKPPISSPTISIGTPTAIYCTSGSNPVILTTGSSTTTSGGGPLAFAVPYLWQGPTPQLDITGTSSYGAFVAGVYTLTIKDNYNGCLKTGTINVLDKTQPPVLTNAADQSTIDCASTNASLYSAITGASVGLKYWYYSYPLGAAFSPTAASIPNINPYLSGTSATTVLVSKSGVYEYVVSNTLTGCQASGTFVVSDGDITADFTADNLVGYAPLTVGFTNTSFSSLSSNSITSIWSFGNGSSQTSTTSGGSSATYNAPGTYTVMLYASKGNCLDTVYKVITVEMPSKMEVPNVFTPNGDGSNDVFFLKTANLSDITALIFDRWGNKVYETTSTTGNIGWDGKNFAGKDCAIGVYFYIVKAKGKDSKDYEAKGNVSLYR
jgi:gliding motility-associated-like protein